jgi:hypothetical protein
MQKSVNRIIFAIVFVLTFTGANTLAQNARSYGSSSSSAYRGGSGQSGGSGRYSPGMHSGGGSGGGHMGGGYAGHTKSGAGSGGRGGFSSRGGYSSPSSGSRSGSYSKSSHSGAESYTGGGGNSYLGNRYGGGGQRQAHQSMRPETEPHLSGVGVGRGGSSRLGSGQESVSHPTHAKHSRGSSTTNHSRPTGGVRQSPSAAGRSFNRPTHSGSRRGTHSSGTGTHSMRHP